jgi:hypothetical protein
VSTASLGALATIAAALLAFATTYVLRRRDERRLGGAAERQLRNRLELSRNILAASEREPAKTWSKPGLRVKLEAEIWDRLVARFRHPYVWDQINSATAQLDVLQTWYESGQPGEMPMDRVRRAHQLVEAVIARLDERERRWLSWRPWLRRGAGERGRALDWARLAAVGLLSAALLVGAVRVTATALDDPTDENAVESELREMDPRAAAVNCVGDDGDDRWSCIVVREGCDRAATESVPCVGVDQVDNFEVQGDSGGDRVYAELLETLAPKADKQATRGLRAWIGYFSREDPAAER